jgi:Transcription factor WhiB
MPRIDDLDWRNLATCAGTSAETDDADPFFDDYEADPFVAQAVDQMCLSCPVIKQCGMTGRRGKEWGVWGGIYLKDGKIDRSRNQHKTDEDWKRLKGIHDWA